MVYNGFRATYLDPTDNTIYIQRHFPTNLTVRGTLRKILNFKCDLCDYMIQDYTKHCKSCNRCAHKFDHHCMWLNNCIGEINYREFIKSCLFLAFHIVISCAFTVTYLVIFND